MLHLLKPFPDELLGSILVRVVRDLGLSNARVMTMLFGGRGTMPVLMTREHGIAHAFGMSLKELLFGHTLLPYAVAFMSAGMREQALCRLLVDVSGGSSPAALSQSSTRFAPFLQFCQGCILEDTAQYGAAYWHRVHQLPGVAICLRHDKPLLVSDLRVSQPRRMVLPDDVVSSREMPALVSKRIGTRIARFSYRALSSKLPNREWKVYYRERAAELGFGYDPKMLAGGLIAADLRAFYGGQFLGSLGLDFDPLGRAQRWPTKIIRNGGHSFSPLRHVLFNVFLESIVAASKPVPDLFSRPHQPYDWASREDEVLRRLEELRVECEAVGGRVRLRDLSERLGTRNYLWGLRKNMPRLVAWMKDFRASDLSWHKTGGRPKKRRHVRKNSTG